MNAQRLCWGGYSRFVRDASGNLLELAVNPAWHLTEDGRTLLAADG